MRRSLKLGVLLVFVALLNGVFLMSIVRGQESEPPHWTYEGEEGPEHWGDLSEDYATCGTGEAQSPIDLTSPVEAGLVNIEFHYSESALSIFNNGHTIQVKYDEGSSIVYNETTFNLLQFHFHHPSEHTVDGEPADMEIHFVHADEKGNLAVVGVLLVVGDEADADYAEIYDNLPAEAGDPPESTELRVNAANLLPEEQTFFTYSGSLTTPPCSQGVRWLVMAEPVQISAEEAEAFGSLFELNARPVQAQNQRDLLLDTSP
jgi:carbonic anhydrase